MHADFGDIDMTVALHHSAGNGLYFRGLPHTCVLQCYSSLNSLNIEHIDLFQFYLEYLLFQPIRENCAFYIHIGFIYICKTHSIFIQLKLF